jgi:hypothetical protein
MPEEDSFLCLDNFDMNDVQVFPDSSVGNPALKMGFV